MIIDDVPDWDHDSPFEKWEPSHAEDARAMELWRMCMTDDPRFGECFDAACNDVLVEKNLPQMWAAMLRNGRDIVEASCNSLKLMQARISADVTSAREDAIKEMLWHDDTD